MPIGWMGAAPVIMVHARRQEHRTGQAILASAMSAYPIAYPAWGTIVALPFSLSVSLGALFIALGSFVAVQVAWLRLRALGGGREALAGTAVTDLALMLGIVMGLFMPTQSPSAAARIHDVVLVAYAILRLQYLGLDLKVRWGISKGIVAGVWSSSSPARAPMSRSGHGRARHSGARVAGPDRAAGKRQSAGMPPPR